MIRQIAALATVLLATSSAHAVVTLPLMFTDGAVLQRDRPLQVWGWATPGAKIRVGFDAHDATTTAAGDGTWRVDLPAHAAGGPFALRVREGDADELVVRDVLVGDVWLCSGQSNMEFTVREAQNAQAEIARGNDPAIRHFKIPRSWATTPEAQLAGGAWVAATPRTVGEFSAVCWFFARELKARNGVPQGLINSTWGGSRIEAWTDAHTAKIDPTAVAASARQLEETETARLAMTRKRLATWPALQADVPGRNGRPLWSEEKLGERDWASIQVPGNWEPQGYYGMDGIAWYRTHFVLSAQEAARGMTLGLARIDDSDRTWVNGVQVGETLNRWNELRAYRVPPQVLHAGLNTLAVRVEDLGGGGGIHGDAAQLYLLPEGGVQRPLEGPWHFRPAAVTLVSEAGYNETPTLLYNRMIHPLLGYALRGVLWYQGEANALPKQAIAYREQFADLIGMFRTAWRQPEMPFLWVQLANFRSGGDTAEESPWAELRESQSATLALAHTGQAVTIDAGDPADIHPKDKQAVAHRLALIARRVVFGESVVASGPAFRALKIDGARARLSFDAADGIAARGGGAQLRGFEIAGDDDRYHAAQASIEGDSIVVSSAEVPHPAAVRYAWSDNPVEANLVDRNGLPASPFRSKTAP